MARAPVRVDHALAHGPQEVGGVGHPHRDAAAASDATHRRLRREHLRPRAIRAAVNDAKALEHAVMDLQGARTRSPLISSTSKPMTPSSVVSKSGITMASSTGAHTTSHESARPRVLGGMPTVTDVSLAKRVDALDWHDLPASSTTAASPSPPPCSRAPNARASPTCSTRALPLDDRHGPPSLRGRPLPLLRAPATGRGSRRCARPSTDASRRSPTSGPPDSAGSPTRSRRSTNSCSRAAERPARSDRRR